MSEMTREQKVKTATLQDIEEFYRNVAIECYNYEITWEKDARGGRLSKSSLHSIRVEAENRLSDVQALRGRITDTYGKSISALSYCVEGVVNYR